MAHLRGSKDVRQDIHLPTLVTRDKYRDESDYCQICRLKGKKRLAEYYCSTCAMPMCPGCQEMHINTRVTHDHFIVPKKEQDVSHATCPVHRFARVQYFCDTCLQLVCVNCTMIEHRKHEIVEIPEKVSRCHQELESTIDDLDTKIASFERDLRKLQEIEAGMEGNREQVKAEINAKVGNLIQVMRKQQDDLLKQIDRYIDEKFIKINKQKDQLQQTYNNFVNARMTADIKNRSDLDHETFIQNVIQLQRQVGSLIEPPDITSVGFKHMHFSLTNDGRLGSIDEDLEEVKVKPKMHKKGKQVKGVVPVKTTNSMKMVPRNDDDNVSEPNIPRTGRSERSTNERLPRSEPALSRNTVSPSRKPDPALLAPRSSSHSQNYYDEDNTPSLRIVNRFKTINYIQNPSGIGVLPNGKYVIADASNYGILMCDKSGRWQQRMLQDEVAFPTGVAINREGNIAIATHKYVKIFRVDGIKVKQFQVTQSVIGSLTIDDYGHYVLIDNLNRQLTVYDDDGLQLRTINPPDLQGLKPDTHNLGVGGDHIALSFVLPDSGAIVKLYNYRGDLLKSCELPEQCKGIQMDRFGNMIVSAGELRYVPAKGNDIMLLRAIDKKGKWLRLNSRMVAFTPQGLICTLHVNKINQRSEVMILHLGG